MSTPKLAVLFYAWTKAAKKGKEGSPFRFQCSRWLHCFLSKLTLDFQLAKEEHAFAFVMWTPWSLFRKGLLNFLYPVLMPLTSTVIFKCTENLLVLWHFFPLCIWILYLDVQGACFCRFTGIWQTVGIHSQGGRHGPVPQELGDHMITTLLWRRGLSFLRKRFVEGGRSLGGIKLR